MLSLYVTRVKDRRKSQKGRNPYPHHKRQRDSLVQTTRAFRTRVSNIIHIQRVRNGVPIACAVDDPLRTTASTVSFSGDMLHGSGRAAGLDCSATSGQLRKINLSQQRTQNASRDINTCTSVKIHSSVSQVAERDKSIDTPNIAFFFRTREPSYTLTVLDEVTTRKCVFGL